MPRTISAFHKAFLDQIRTNGRLHEVGLVMEYKLRSGDLMKDVTNAPALFTRGKLSTCAPTASTASPRSAHLRAVRVANP